jgi:AraC-like DNA-binding protein
MCYQRGKLVELAVDLVRRQPCITVAELSEMLGVHRHTLQRTLKASDRTFPSVKQAVVLERLERHFASAQPASLKQVWTELGFASASAFARYVRRATGKAPTNLRAESILGHSAHKRAQTALDAPEGDG